MVRRARNGRVGVGSSGPYGHDHRNPAGHFENNQIFRAPQLPREMANAEAWKAIPIQEVSLAAALKVQHIRLACFIFTIFTCQLQSALLPKLPPGYHRQEISFLRWRILFMEFHVLSVYTTTGGRLLSLSIRDVGGRGESGIWSSSSDFRSLSSIVSGPQPWIQGRF